MAGGQAGGEIGVKVNARACLEIARDKREAKRAGGAGSMAFVLTKACARLRIGGQKQAAKRGSLRINNISSSRQP